MPTTFIFESQSYCTGPLHGLVWKLAPCYCLPKILLWYDELFLFHLPPTVPWWSSERDVRKWHPPSQTGVAGIITGKLSLSRHSLGSRGNNTIHSSYCILRAIALMGIIFGWEPVLWPLKSQGRVMLWLKKKHRHFQLQTASFEPRHENKSCSACPEDQLKPFKFLKI